MQRYTKAIGPRFAPPSQQFDDARQLFRVPDDWLDNREFMPIRTPKDIVKDFCAEHQVGILEILGENRTKRVVHKRWHLMWILRKETVLSMPQIAKLLRRTDHTNVVHGLQQHAIRMAKGLV